MKTLVTILAAAALFLTSCTTQYKATATYDDLYYSPKDAVAEAQSKPVTAITKSEADAYSAPAQQYTQQAQSDYSTATQQQYQSEGQYFDENDYSSGGEYTDPSTGNTYITNNYYDSDDYYDYAYAARLRRFHSDFYYSSYYSPYYTNMYWYDYNPWSWGTSIYMGYNWWYPSFGFSWGYPSYWRYSYWDSYYGYGWGYPYYGFGYGSYWSGYNHGYWNGYWDGFYDGNGYYYNSFDNNSYYYGHRNSSLSGGSGSGRNAGTSFGERYESAIKSGRIDAPRNSSGTAISGSGRNSGTGRTGTSTTGRTEEPGRPAGTSTTGRTEQPGTVTPGRTEQPANVTPGRTTQPGTVTPGRTEQPGTVTPGRTEQPANVTPGRTAQPGTVTPGRTEPGRYSTPANPGTTAPAAAKNLAPAIRVMLSLAAIMLLLTLEPLPRRVPSPAVIAHHRILAQEMNRPMPALRVRANADIRHHSNVRCKGILLRNIVLRVTISRAPAMNLLLRNTGTTAKPVFQESPVRHGHSKAHSPGRQRHQISRPGSNTER